MGISGIFAMGGGCDYGRYHHKGHYYKGYYGHGGYYKDYCYRDYGCGSYGNYYYKRHRRGGLLGIL